ncbi:Uncharacterised protein [Mycobacteroides abscessus subsp. abscessus]|nr:Uncharacterised protein [Mycobacteroides abscessus subsp. abscessus]
MVGRAKCADLVTFVEDALPAALQLVAKPLQLRRTLTGPAHACRRTYLGYARGVKSLLRK